MTYVTHLKRRVTFYQTLCRLLRLKRKVKMETITRYVLSELMPYIANDVQSKTLVKKLTGDITAFSFAAGTVRDVKSIPFDSHIQIIDGAAEITINTTVFYLAKSHFLIVPAHKNYALHAKVQFKMLLTVIKSGYED